MFIVAVMLLAVLFLGYRRLYKTNKENLATWNADTFENRFSTVALENGVEWAASYEYNYLGFKLVGHDAEGSTDPWYMAFEDINLYQARYNSRLNGVPGGGLETSRFSSDTIASGRAGEETLARIIVGSNLKVVSFWSLYGKDSKGNPTDADVDCALVGVNKSGKVHVWFVDAKNYKGGSDTKYVNVGHDENGHNVIARISKSKHALISGKMENPTLSPRRIWPTNSIIGGICRDWSGVGVDAFMAELDGYMEYYCEGRIKESLGWMSPNEYRRSLGYSS